MKWYTPAQMHGELAKRASPAKPRQAFVAIRAAFLGSGNARRMNVPDAGLISLANRCSPEARGSSICDRDFARELPLEEW